jgi:hypothetical protein
MLSLEISLIGSACGKNPYEPRNKTIFTQLCKTSPLKYKNLLIEKGIIVKTQNNSKEKEFEAIYKKYKTDITSPKEFEKLETKIIEEFKLKEPEEDTKNLINNLRSNMKKDCGTNNEKKVIEKKKFKKGNNILWIYKDFKGWELKGFHDATDDEIVIEVKTRMRKNTVRKNKYDLYQLFGYLLAMNKTKGKIIQVFDKEIFDSDIETDCEYGIIDISTERYSKEFNTFKLELNNFFEEITYYYYNDFNIHLVFGKLTTPIAEYNENGVFNILDGYEKIVKLIM